jgi:hypothetical protein
VLGFLLDEVQNFIQEKKEESFVGGVVALTSLNLNYAARQVFCQKFIFFLE